MLIACVISNSLKEELFDSAISTLRNIIPIKISTKLILSADDLTERKLSKKYCQNKNYYVFHFIFWNRYGSGKNQQTIKMDWLTMCKMFINILKSESEDEVNFSIKKLLEMVIYPQLTDYISKYYLENDITRWWDTNNYVKVMFCLYTDFQWKELYLSQLTNFLVNNI